MDDPELTMRIRMATRGHTGRQVAAIVGMNHETVRRYLKGANPSIEFIKQVCVHYGVLADWLVLGDGPRTREDLKDELLEGLDSERFAEAWAERFTRFENRLVAIEHLLTSGDRSPRGPAIEIDSGNRG